MSNEITAYFKGRTGVAESVYQYDYGMVIVFDSIELPATFDCYFSNEGDEVSIPVIGADNRAAIPNECLSVPGRFTVHIPLQTGLNDSEVEYVATVKVINRARPEDNGTEEERSAISEAIAALNHNNLPGLVPDIVTEWLDEHPEATTTVQDGAITDAKINSQSSIAFNAEGGYFYASRIGLDERNARASANVTILNNFMTAHPNANIVMNNGMVFPFDSPIALRNNVHLVGGGQLKYVGEEIEDYFITTYANGTNWVDIIPQNSYFEINIDCSGKSQGIYFSGGIHNRIVANVKNAKGNGYYLALGSGYENVHLISVMNDDEAVYADSVGVYCNKSDEVFEAIFTRNCNIGLYMHGSGNVKLIHSWCYGDNVYPDSKTVKIYGSQVTIDYLYSDTMQYPLYFERLTQGTKVDTIFCYHNSAAVSQSVATDNPFRPWKSDVQPTMGQKFMVKIGSLTLPSINGTYQNNLTLEAFDGFVEITSVDDLQVIGDFKFIPLCTCYCGGNKLTNTPSGYNNNYKTIRAYRNSQYKYVELKNDYPASDPFVYVSISLQTWISKWMTVTKTQLAEVQPS